ncbi:MAG: hypothetical protein ACP5N9_06490, partial [Candidatus Bilamarchaeum sp.]
THKDEKSTMPAYGLDMIYTLISKNKEFWLGCTSSFFISLLFLFLVTPSCFFLQDNLGMQLQCKTTAPQITFIAPNAYETLYTNETVSILFDALDKDSRLDLESLQVNLYENNNLTRSMNLSNCTNNSSLLYNSSFHFNCEVSNLSVGTYEIYTTISDRSGNTINQQNQFKVSELPQPDILILPDYSWLREGSKNNPGRIILYNSGNAPLYEAYFAYKFESEDWKFAPLSATPIPAGSYQEAYPDLNVSANCSPETVLNTETYSVGSKLYFYAKNQSQNVCLYENIDFVVFSGDPRQNYLANTTLYYPAREGNINTSISPGSNSVVIDNLTELPPDAISKGPVDITILDQHTYCRQTSTDFNYCLNLFTNYFNTTSLITN